MDLVGLMPDAVGVIPDKKKVICQVKGRMSGRGIIIQWKRPKKKFDHGLLGSKY